LVLIFELTFCFVFRTVDDVDNIMDDIRDRMDDQDAISDALSQPLLDGFLDEVSTFFPFM